MPIRPLRPLRTPLVLLALAASLPTLAAPAPPQRLPLQYAVPGDVLKAMHWDQGAALPEGVTKVSAQPGDNSLLVEGTPEGLSRVRDIVKELDVAPRQVRMSIHFALVPAAAIAAAGLNFKMAPSPESGSNAPGIRGVLFASGPAAARLLTFVTSPSKQGRVVNAPMITTTNDTSASITQVTGVPYHTANAATAARGAATQGFVPVTVSYTITPHIKADQTVTLVFKTPASPPTARGTAGPSPKGVTLGPVESGGTIVAGSAPFLKPLRGDTVPLVFITPTILPPEGQSAQPAH